MSMRVIECNVCGEALAAATDEELLVRMRLHVAAEHGDAGFDESRAREQIAHEAYAASDS